MHAMVTPNPVVVVPVHRAEPSPDEQISLRRCSDVLGSHPIHIVHPAGLDLQAYFQLLPGAFPQPVPPSWMASIRAYNCMILNPSFYENFDGFSHLLIHEPDSLVLADQLTYWCCQSYDYIGAPWFDGFAFADSHSSIVGVGNSGFSLLRLAAMQRLLSSSYRWISYSQIMNGLLKRMIRLPCRHSYSTLIRMLGGAGLLNGVHLVMAENCDEFLCTHFPLADPAFSIATVKDALRFAWEVNPSVCHNLNHGSLPFGIHAWARYDRQYVEQLINEL